MAEANLSTFCVAHHREDSAATLLKDREDCTEPPAAIIATTPAADAATAPNACRFLKRKRPTKLMIPPVLEDIPLEAVRVRDGATGDSNEGLGEASGPGWGVFSKKGWSKKPMEDAHQVISAPKGHPDKTFFGVYDGHGGRSAVEYVLENLHRIVFEILGKCDDMERKDAIKAGFLNTDQGFLKQGNSSGSCCVTALIEKEVIVVSNLGDCRAVLSRDGIAEALTSDHTAGRIDEKKRIQQKGGCIELCNKTWRVQGILAVTRSIGDIHLKEWILAEPDTVVLPLASDMEFLILASDGLWKKVGNQEAVDVVTKINDDKGNVRNKTEAEADKNQFGCENTSPSPKLRKTESIKQQKVPQSSDQVVDSARTCPSLQNMPLSSGQEMDPTRVLGSSRITRACKRLAGIAAKKGSSDDITVMIIDLRHFFRN